MADSNAQIISSGRELDLFIAHLTTKGIVATIVVAIVAVVLLVQDGLSTRSLVLLIGALASLIGLFGYIAGVVRRADTGVTRRSFVPMLQAFGGFVPYVFGCYLVFYEGFWNFWRLVEGFTWRSMWAALFYLIAGYLIVLAIYKASEFGRGIDEGRIVVKKTAT